MKYKTRKIKYGTWNMKHETLSMELENETITMKNRIWYTKHGNLNTGHETWKWNKK